MLLREPRFFRATDLEIAGERAWGKSFDGKQDPAFGVVQSGPVTFIRAGTYVMHVLHANQPYLGDVENVATQLPNLVQQVAWRAHNAWSSFDLLNSTAHARDSYIPLAKFASQMADSNCAGIYLPKNQIMWPNDGTAEQGLRMLIRSKLF